MKKLLILISLFAFTLCLIGQSTDSDEIIPEHSCILYLMRPSVGGFAAPYAIYADTVHLGTIRAKTYYKIIMPAGEYELKSPFAKKKYRYLKVELKEGEKHYIKVDWMAKLEVITKESKYKKYLRTSNNNGERMELAENFIRYK